MRSKNRTLINIGKFGKFNLGNFEVIDKIGAKKSLEPYDIKI